MPLGHDEEVAARALYGGPLRILARQMAKIDGHHKHKVGSASNDDGVVDATVLDHLQHKVNFAELGIARAEDIRRAAWVVWWECFLER